MARASKRGDTYEIARGRSSTPLLDREQLWESDNLAESDEELDEFVEFFTKTRPDLVAVHIDHEPGAQFGAPAPRRNRLARATEQVRNLVIIRPEVSLGWLHTLPLRVRLRREIAARLPRRVKLPPVWVIAQVAIVLALLVAFVPQVLHAPWASGCAWYTVQSGDTVSEISGLVGVSAKDIASANHLQNTNLIHVNQQLCIPAASGLPLNAAIGLVSVELAPIQILNAPHRVRAFIAFSLPYARETSRRTGWPVSMLLAQWGLEKSWRPYTFTGYNWGNCGAMPGEPAIPGTSVPGSPASFAFAYTPQQGVAEYVHVAHLRYYAGVAPAWRGGGANAAARALGASPWDWGHYTNLNSPGSSLIALMRAYNLYWYDKH
jgi:LysM repeat protein